jgi:hypothetical protein
MTPSDDDREPIPDTVQDFADWADGPEVTSSPLVGEVQRLRQQLQGAVDVLERIADGRYLDANQRQRRFTSRALRDIAAEALAALGGRP